MNKLPFGLESPPCLTEVIIEIGVVFEYALDDNALNAFHESVVGKGLTRNHQVDRLMMCCQRLGCAANCVVNRAKENESLVVDDIDVNPYISDQKVVNPIPGCLLYFKP